MSSAGVEGMYIACRGHEKIRCDKERGVCAQQKEKRRNKIFLKIIQVVGIASGQSSSLRESDQSLSGHALAADRGAEPSYQRQAARAQPIRAGATQNG